MTGSADSSRTHHALVHFAAWAGVDLDLDQMNFRQEARGPTYARTREPPPLPEWLLTVCSVEAPPNQRPRYDKAGDGGATAGSVGRTGLRRPGRYSDEPRHSLPIDFHQHRLLARLGVLELGDRLLGIADLLAADLLEHVTRLQTLLVGRAARLDGGDQRAVDVVLQAELLARIGRQRRQREAERTGRSLLGHLLLVGLGLLGGCRVTELGGDGHVLAVAHQANLHRGARLGRRDG